MAKYNVPFVNINTFIYEPTYVEKPSTFDIETFEALRISFSNLGLALYPNHLNTEAYYKENIRLLGGSTNYIIRVQQNTLGILHNTINIREINSYANTAFFEGQARLPTTASFFTALNLKRNGPYGYPTWRQIRAHENPLTRNQRKNNIMTIRVGGNNDNSFRNSVSQTNRYSDSRVIEVFKEPVFSSREKPFLISYPDLNNPDNSLLVKSYQVGNLMKYFDNDRLNNLYTPYNQIDELSTDRIFFTQILSTITEQQIPPVLFDFSHNIFPQKNSLEYNKRTRKEFYFNWNSKSEDRYDKTLPYVLGALDLEPGRGAVAYPTVNSSYWPLDIHSNYNSLTSRSPIGGKYNDETNSGILQHSLMYGRELALGSGIGVLDLASNNLQVHPLYAFKHTITPLTSCVGPHGTDIEGVNSGALFNDLDTDSLLSGEASWDAPSHYGTGPFYDTYQEYINDIKRVGKEHCIIPEFRSSEFVSELQASQDITPKSFLNITGAAAIPVTTGYISSSQNSSFFKIYSHTDFMKHFDVAQEVSDELGMRLTNMSLKCKAIKKFIPYNGFYPAQRTVDIANKFMESVHPNVAYFSSYLGDMSASAPESLPYFNNVMTPMFAPGIMFNSIKSGIAVDYPIHTSSLTLANGGVNIYDDNYYIQKPFDERIPFEALLEPSIYLSNKEIHCSEPHPSGNLSGSATWNGTGDTTEYQLMMHNFLAETPSFFLQDQNFSFIESKKSKDTNLNLVSGSYYYLQIDLYKSQNFASKENPDNLGFGGDLIMTGSGVQETFTMYSRPSAFGPPSLITSSDGVTEFTASYSHRGQNYPFTPPYYDGKSSMYLIFNANETKRHTVEEIFNSSSVSSFRHSKELVDLDAAEDLRRAMYHSTKESDMVLPSVVNSICFSKASININLGFVKEIDLLDDDTSDTVKVAVDISSDQDSQIIIQPKWETPMFNFQSYGDSDTINLPLVGSQSVPRGIWHQYGAIEKDETKGVFMKVSPVIGVSPEFDLSKRLGFSTEPVKLGKTASKKVVREAIIAVPFYDYTPDARFVEEERKFIMIPRSVIDDAKEGQGKQNVIDMVNKMQRFVMPPMFNFLEDQEINPITMYIFDFKHTFDQEDLGAIWQNLPPKLMTEFQTEEKTISHTFDEDELLSLAALEEEGDPKEIMKRMKWMVFKVKQKAEQNYYDKIVGETQTLNKKSRYSHNWPYDYFSLVELANMETKVSFDRPPEQTESETAVQEPPSFDIEVAPSPIFALPANNTSVLPGRTTVFTGITDFSLPTGSGGL